ncbi:hypothetical protein Q7P35_009553 [Cladosporium inversicolor]
MIDPITAFALAANIVQFIEVGYKATNILHQLWAESKTDENLELETAIIDLQDICTKLTPQPQTSTSPSDDDKKLRTLAQSCQKLSKELEIVLQKLVVISTVPDLRRRFEVMQKTLKSMLEAKKISELQRRLGVMREQLAVRMMYILTNRQSKIFQTLEEIDTKSQKQSDLLGQQLREARREAQIACETQIEKAKKLEVSIDAINITIHDLKHTIDKLILLSEHVVSTQKSTDILRSLQFPLMYDRYRLIKERHQHTLSWIFDTTASPFTNWLEQDNGAFWISGKAGSGKSTLMKHLNQSPQTRESLKVWAGKRQLFVADFYFWITGTRMQNTQEGLVQSILHEILRQEPALIEKAVPARWEQNALFHQNPSPWALTELYDALDAVMREKPAACFCFFIDGLDEYSGDAGEQGRFAAKILKLASSPAVKVCVASRPWTAFDDVFGGHPKRMLAVEDFTRDDMARFVRDTLEESPQFAAVISQDPRAKALIQEIQDGAQGVFLWVTLVVKSLLSGATQQDDVEELTVRLRELPRDLKGFFQRMLDSVDDSYEVHASRILLLTQTTTPLPLMAFSWVRLEIRNPEYAVQGKIEQLDDDERRKRQARLFLNKWSKDLLVVYDSGPRGDGTGDIADLKIDFLHRTVGEFLREPDVHSILLSKAGPTFDAHQSICRLLLAELKTLRTLRSPAHHLATFQTLAQRLIFHAKQYEQQNSSALVDVLRMLDIVMASRLSGICSSHWTTSIEVAHPGKVGNHRATLSHSSSNFLAYAVGNDLVEFVKETLEASPETIRKPGRPLLDYALYSTFARYDKVRQSIRDEYPERMIELLLKHGSSPNLHAAVIGAMTVWQMFLLDNRATKSVKGSNNAHLDTHNREPDDGGPDDRSLMRSGAWAVAQLLLQHHADRKVKVPIGEVISIVIHDSFEGRAMDMQRTTTKEAGLRESLEQMADRQVIESFLAKLPDPGLGFWRYFWSWMR